MDSLFKGIGVLCITAYIMGIITNLIPLGYTQKAIRLTVAIYIITSVFIPFDNLCFDFTYNQPDSEDYTVQAQKHVIEETEIYIKNNISNQLDEKSISYNSVDVHIHEQSKGMEIENIYIYGVPEEQRQSIEKILSLEEKIIFGD